MLENGDRKIEYPILEIFIRLRRRGIVHNTLINMKKNTSPSNYKHLCTTITTT